MKKFAKLAECGKKVQKWISVRLQKQKAKRTNLKTLVLRISLILLLGVSVFIITLQTAGGFRGFSDIGNFWCQRGDVGRIMANDKFIGDSNLPENSRSIIAQKVDGIEYTCLSLSNFKLYKKQIRKPVDGIVALGTKKAEPEKGATSVNTNGPTQARPVAPVVRNNYYVAEQPPAPEKSCFELTIYYQTKTIYQEGENEGRQVVTEGRNGKKRICNGIEEVILQPIDQLETITRKPFKLRDVHYEPVPASNWKYKPTRSSVNKYKKAY